MTGRHPPGPPSGPVPSVSTRHHLDYVTDATARLLEVDVIETDDQDYVIHAMTTSNYLSMLETPGGG